MTNLKADAVDYRIAMRRVAEAGEEALYRFYKCGNNFEKRSKVFDSQIMPFVEKYGTLRRSACLDIGYGPGALVLSALSHFNISCGVDVHQEMEFILDILHRKCEEQGIRKGYIWLKSTERDTIPFDTNSMDLVYSWTVFMHLGDITIADSYLKETFRVLRPGGLAVIYFARIQRSKKRQTKEEWKHDIKHEQFEWLQKDNVKIQKINLTISMKWMVNRCKEIGFEVLEETASTINIHEITYYCGQHGVVLRKPREEQL